MPVQSNHDPIGYFLIQIITNMMTSSELEQYMNQLLEWDALEICREEGCSKESGSEKSNLLIPYVMNDAAEYYLRLTDCVVQGDLPEGIIYPERFALEKTGDRTGLILYGIVPAKEHEEGKEEGRGAGSGDDSETCVIWFSEAIREEHCYRYHRIGHDWRETPGEESLRRIVNLLCVIHDKKTYLGDSATNSEEQRLYPLIEFAPICYYSPIDQSINSWYPETTMGIRAAAELAAEVGDQKLENLILRYQTPGKISNHTDREIAEMAQELVKAEHAAFWKKILEWIRQGSEQWPHRSSVETPEAARLREEMVDKYQKMGYTGEYPVMRYEGTESDACAASGAEIEAKGTTPSCIRFVEEHPFTVMESADYRFFIHIIEEPYAE